MESVPATPRLVSATRRLLRLLRSRRAFEADAALNVLHRAAAYERLHGLLLEAGALHALVSLLRRTAKRRLLRRAVAVLVRLTSAAGALELCALRYGVLPALLRLAHRGTVSQSAAAIEVLSHLVSLPLSHPLLRSHGSAVCLLAGVMPRATELAAAVVSPPELRIYHHRRRLAGPAGRRQLSSSALERIFVALIQVTFDSPAHQRATLAAPGLVACLVHILRNALVWSPAVLRHASWLLAHLAQPDVFKARIGAMPGVLAFLAALVGHTSPVVVASALMALVNLTTPGVGLNANGAAVATLLDWLLLLSFLDVPPAAAASAPLALWVVQKFVVWLLLHVCSLPRSHLLTYCTESALEGVAQRLAGVLATAVAAGCDEGGDGISGPRFDVVVRGVAALGNLIPAWPKACDVFVAAGGVESLVALMRCSGPAASAIRSNTALCLSLLVERSPAAAHACLLVDVLPVLSDVLAGGDPAAVAHAALALAPLAHHVLRDATEVAAGADCHQDAAEQLPHHKRLLVQLVHLLTMTRQDEVANAVRHALHHIFWAVAEWGAVGDRSALLAVLQDAYAELWHDYHIVMKVVPI